MLGILILQKNIHKELEKLIKKLVKHIINPEKITEEGEEFISDLDYDGIFGILITSLLCKKKC